MYMRFVTIHLYSSSVHTLISVGSPDVAFTDQRQICKHVQ